MLRTVNATRYVLPLCEGGSLPAIVEADALGRNEPDAEIRHLLKTSAGLNLALDYLPGSTMFVPAARDTASRASFSCPPNHSPHSAASR